MILLMWNTHNRELQGDKARIGGCQGQGEEGDSEEWGSGEKLTNGYEVSLCSDGNILKLDVSGAYGEYSKCRWYKQYNFSFK